MRNIMLLKIKFVCIKILYKFYFTKEILFPYYRNINFINKNISTPTT